MSGALWWLSFCDSSKPEGQRFLGVAIVSAGSLPEAVTEAWKARINPGGSVRGFALPRDRVADHWVGRLLSEDEAVAAGGVAVTR